MATDEKKKTQTADLAARVLEKVRSTTQKVEDLGTPSMYVLGIKHKSKCPRQVVVIGGVDFPLSTEVVESLDGTPHTTRSRRWGAVKTLYPYEVKRVLAAMETYVFRGRRLVSTKAKRYRPHAEDVPVAHFLYFKKIASTDMVAVMQDKALEQQFEQLKISAEESERAARNTDLTDEARRKVSHTAKVTGSKLDN